MIRTIDDALWIWARKPSIVKKRVYGCSGAISGCVDNVKIIPEGKRLGGVVISVSIGRPGCMEINTEVN